MLRRLVTQTIGFLALHGVLLFGGAAHGIGRRPGRCSVSWCGQHPRRAFADALRPGAAARTHDAAGHSDQARRDKLILLGIGLLWFVWLFAMGPRRRPASLAAGVAVLGRAAVHRRLCRRHLDLRRQQLRLARRADAARPRPPRHRHRPLRLGSPPDVWRRVADLPRYPAAARLPARPARGPGLPSACWRSAPGGRRQALRAGLPGYDAYAARIRHRFVPGLW